MTIEQKSELNRFVDSSIPLTWRWRWQQFKITLPIWVFIWVCFLEMWLFRAWLADRLTLDFILTMIGSLLFLMLFIFGIIEVQVRIQQRSKRIMQFKVGKIIVKPAKNQIVRWKNIGKFQFEPIPEAPGLTKLKLFLRARSTKKISRRAYWTIVLESPSQVQELVKYLQTKRMEFPTDYGIEILERPVLLENSARFPFFGISLYMGGILLLLQGVPLLAVFLHQSHHSSEGNSKFSPQEIAKLGHFLREHFASKEQFHYFFVNLSIGMIVAGVVMLIWGWWLMNQKTANIPAAIIPPARQF